jgi:hypothetical protein
LILCEKKHSWPTWSTTVIRTVDRGWCPDLIWSGLWIGTDAKACCHEKIWTAKWIGNEVAGNFHDKFEVPYGLEPMIAIVMT